jgi:hypothetical protein
MRWMSFASVVLGVVGLVGCREDVESEDIRTSGIYPRFEVLAEGDGSSTASSYMVVDGRNSNTYLDLTGADEVVVTADGQSRTLGDSSPDGYYRSTFATDAGGTVFTFAFNRGASDDGAPDSSVTLPDPFVLAGLASGDTVSRATGVTLTWDPSSSPTVMTLTVEPNSAAAGDDCLFAEDRTISDSGSVTVEGTDFNVHSGDEQNSCGARVCVERTNEGTIDSHFSEEGGEIFAIQRRCINFTSAP